MPLEPQLLDFGTIFLTELAYEAGSFQHETSHVMDPAADKDCFVVASLPVTSIPTSLSF